VTGGPPNVFKRIDSGLSNIHCGDLAELAPLVEKLSSESSGAPSDEDVIETPSRGSSVHIQPILDPEDEQPRKRKRVLACPLCKM